MKPLDKYGPALLEYEGMAVLTIPHGPGKPGTCRGYFQAKQLMSGKIAVGFVPITDKYDQASEYTAGFNLDTSFGGRDLKGWDIETCGQALFLPFGPLSAVKRTPHPTTVFGSQCIKAKSSGASHVGYSLARFRLSNLLWHGKPRVEIPNPIRLNAGGMAIMVSATSDYLEAADNLRAVRGVLPTAEALVETADGSCLSLEAYGDFMNDLVSVFRLATGNGVDWYYGEAFEVGSERVAERLHNNATTSPFSTMITFRRGGSIVNFGDLAQSFFDNDKLVLEQAVLKKLINYFVSSCDDTSYLELGALLSSTLLDLIVLKYTTEKNLHNVMEEEDYTKSVLPILKDAIKDANHLKASNDLRTSVNQQLRGAYRRSFRNRLNLLAKELTLGLNSNSLKKAVDIRNELVHEGRFLSIDRYGDWNSQYRLIIWLNLAALCRLTGYDGDLPLIIDGRSLEV